MCGEYNYSFPFWPLHYQICTNIISSNYNLHTHTLSPSDHLLFWSFLRALYLMELKCYCDDDIALCLGFLSWISMSLLDIVMCGMYIFCDFCWFWGLCCYPFFISLWSLLLILLYSPPSSWTFFYYLSLSLSLSFLSLSFSPSLSPP